MRPANMEITEIEEVIARNKRGRPRKRQRAEKACARAKAVDLVVEVESREKCLDALVEPVEAIRTDLQIVGDDIVELTGANCDSEYMLFLDNARVVENQFLLEYNEGDGETRFCRYEVDDGPHESRVARKKKKKSRETRNAKEERTVGASKRQRTENGRGAESLCNPRTVAAIKMGKGDVQRGRKSSVFKKNVELEAKSNVSRQRKRRSNRQPIVEELNFEAREKKTEEYLEMEDYIFYLRHMMDAERNSGIIPHKVRGTECKEKPESSSDSDIIAVDDHPFPDGDITPFVAAKNDNVVDVDEENGGSGQICSSWFRKELMDVLRKSYSEKELNKLSRAASIQKPKIRARELRDGRVITYKVDIPGKSYLHHAPDFRGLFMRRFGSAKFKHLLQLSPKDRHRALNLLRGFFFYMKNVVHEDAFKPWVDAECLKTMPSTTAAEPPWLLPAVNDGRNKSKKLYIDS